MTFGNAINRDSQLLSAHTRSDLDKSALEYMSNMLQTQQEIILIAQKSQEENDTRYIATHENRGNFKRAHFPISSCVLVEYESREASKRRGPHRVINHIGTVYALENLVTGKLRDFHIKL